MDPITVWYDLILQMIFALRTDAQQNHPAYVSSKNHIANARTIEKKVFADAPEGKALIKVIEFPDWLKTNGETEIVGWTIYNVRLTDRLLFNRVFHDLIPEVGMVLHSKSPHLDIFRSQIPRRFADKPAFVLINNDALAIYSAYQQRVDRNGKPKPGAPPVAEAIIKAMKTNTPSQEHVNKLVAQYNDFAVYSAAYARQTPRTRSSAAAAARAQNTRA